MPTEIPGGVYVVLPAYRTKNTILSVLGRLGPEVDRIIVVDDGCPERTGRLAESECADPLVTVIVHEKNLGVGGPSITGYRRALAEGAGVVVKLDSDGQMDPTLIPLFLGPLLSGIADYTKGNRFFRQESLSGMPATRILGNAALSFFTTFASGHYSVLDPTNGMGDAEVPHPAFFHAEGSQITKRLVSPPPRFLRRNSGSG